jgi:NAD(P)-dependent dehydrogenase (short-subunit alcohol dehydrogenase family)
VAGTGHQGPARFDLTAAWDQVSEVDRRRSLAMTVAGRFGAPDEVAAAYVFGTAWW